MTVVYFIQAHRDEEQVLNLVNVLLGDPRSFVFLSFDSKLPTTLQLDRPNYFARASAHKIQRGDFTPLDEYLGALRWLQDEGIAYDWFVNLCGQSLPVQPVHRIADEIASCSFDAVMHHFPMFVSASDWPARECSARVGFRYRKLVDRPLRKRERAMWKGVRLLNSAQPWVRLETAYGLLLGTRTQPPPGLKFFGGSYFKYLSRACAEFLLEYCAQQPAALDYFRHILVPDEIFTQTILLSHSFRVSGDLKMFFRFTSGRGGHPLNLEPPDLAHTAGHHFARKFEFGSPAYREAVARLTSG